MFGSNNKQLTRINKYKDKGAKLNYARKDAEDFAARLAARAASLFGTGVQPPAILTDAAATREGILNQLEQWSTVIRPNDAFVFFVAGHGVLNDGEYGMVTHDYDGVLSKEDIISTAELLEASKKIEALNQLLVLDTRHAGGIDSLMRGLYDARLTVLARNMGLPHIFASASAFQEALDGYEGNGLLTHALLSGLNAPEADANHDDKVSMMELGIYACQTSIALARQRQFRQSPVIEGFGRDREMYSLH